MSATKPSVLVYNPISGHGHLDSWNAIFVAQLLERGWTVNALTPDVPALMSRLSLKGLAGSPRLRVLEWKALRAIDMKPKYSLGERWARMFEPGAKRDCRPNCSAEAAAPDPEENYFAPAEFAARVNAAIRKAAVKPAVVFNMYMDMYKTDAESWGRFSQLEPLPWAGIRFVPREVPSEGYYRQPSLLGMCLLDEGACRTYGGLIRDKRFEYLPDVTDVGLPAEASALAEEIRRRADGRKIVFLGGSIGGQKNLSRWYEVIELADRSRWFFVQIGELHKGTFTAEDDAVFRKTMADPPENFFIKAEYLPDEVAFNEIIKLSDVLFAVYRDFKISSNMLCKAASFEKPILASDRYLMGERVNRYKIGVAVAEDSADAILAGLHRLADNPIARENFLEFRRHFSQEALAERLDDFLMKCLHSRVS